MMAVPSRRPSKRKEKRKSNTSAFGLPVALACFLAVGWVWLVAGIHLHEMVVGFVVVLAGTAFMLLVCNSSRTSIPLYWRDVVQCWRIPWYMITDTWVITVVLLKDVFHVNSAGSYYRVCGFKTSKRDKRVIAREILATVYTTATPNSIVIGIDPELSRMLFHQIARSPVSKMTQALGARP